MKKTLSFILVILFIFSLQFVSPTLRSAQGGPAMRIAAVSDDSTTNDRLLYEMYRRIGYNIYFDAMTMQMACYSVNIGEADGLETVSDFILNNYPDVLIIPEPISQIDFLAYTMDSADYKLAGWQTLSGLRVGMLSGKLYIQNSLPEDIAALKEYASFQYMNQALVNNEIDVLITTKGVNQVLETLPGVRMLSVLETVVTNTAVNKAHAELIPMLDQALKDMKADGTYDRIVRNAGNHGGIKQVMHISSYSPEDSWDAEIQSSIMHVLEQYDGIVYCNVPLNSNRYQSTVDMTANAYSNIRTLTMKALPDLVIVSDNAALNFVREHGAFLFEKTPIIYCGITGSRELFSELEGRFYGLEETSPTLENALLIDELCTDAEYLFVLNDKSLNGQLVKQVMQDDLAKYNGRLKFIYNESYDLDSLLAELRTLPAHTPVLLGTFATNENGSGETRQYIYRKISENAPGPLFCVSSMGNGETGGIRSSATLQGTAIAKIAVDILHGSDPSVISYPTPDQLHVTEFDWDKLIKYNLQPSVLPKETVFLNRPMPLSESNPLAFQLVRLTIILTSLLAVAGLVLAIRTNKRNKILHQAQQSLVSLAELQKVNEELHETSERLELAMTSANSCSWKIDLEKRIIIFDDKLRELLEFDYDSPAPLEAYSAHYRSLLYSIPNLPYGAVLSSITSNPDYVSEDELRLPSGKHIFVRGHSKSVRNSEGEPIQAFGMLLDITAQEEAKKDALEMATRILNSIDEEVYVSDIETDELLFVNDAKLRAMNIHSYEGQKCWALFSNCQSRCETCPKKILDPSSDDVYMWENLQPVLKRHYRHMDKYIKWIDGQRVLLHASFDISDIRNAEAALKKQFEQQKLIADISSALIQFGDLDMLIMQTLEKTGQAMRCDRVLLNMLTSDTNELVPTYEWVSPDAAYHEKRSKSILVTPGTAHYERFVLSKAPAVYLEQYDSPFVAGENVGIQCAVESAVNVDGAFAGLLEFSCEKEHVWSDQEIQSIQLLSNIFAMLIARQRIADQLVKAKDVAEDAKYVAEEANVAKSQFLSNMSHEIRTPLSAITGLVQVLKQRLINNDILKILGDIEVSSTHLQSIINDVLDMSKIEAGKMVLDVAPFSLKQAFGEVESIFFIRTQEKAQTFEAVFDADESLYVLGDKLMLKQVIINLLSNAVKFTDTGGHVKLLLRTQKKDSSRIDVYVEVQDNGIGMTEKQLAKLFRPFEQTDRNIATRYGGTGLGLSISQRLVDLMGGRIDVESHPQEGSKFFFHIPFAPCEATYQVYETDTLRRADFSGKRVMLVEDIAINRMIIVELFQETGLQFIEAENGQQAVDKYLADPEGYDLILMDILMPVMDGLEAARRIRSHDALRTNPIPIVALTANAFHDDVAACKQAGMNDHVSKPIDINQLTQVIRKYI